MANAWSIFGWMKRGGWLLAASIILLTGCQAAVLAYKGAKVRDAFLIPLTEGPQRSASYQSPDLIIEYQWMRSGSELRLSGTARYTPRIQHCCTMVPYFDLSLLLTDAGGTVLEQRWIVTLGSSDTDGQMRIDEKFLLPPGTAKMAFTYSGQAIDSDGAGDDRGGGEMPFWQIPIVR